MMLGRNILNILLISFLVALMGFLFLFIVILNIGNTQIYV